MMLKGASEMKVRSAVLAVVSVLLLGSFALSDCFTASEMDAATKSALESSAQRYFLSAQANDTTALQQAATASFSGIADVVAENKAAFTEKPVISKVFLLDNTPAPGSQAASTPPARVEFYCGIYNSPERVGFVFPKLPASKYAVVLMEVTGKPYKVTWILEQAAGGWKIADLIVRATQVSGHDSTWFLTQARAFKAKGQMHNAWFYYLIADDLSRPLSAMSTPQLDKLYDEAQQALPKDLPYNGPVDLMANGKIYKVTDIFPTPVGDVLDVVVKYQTADLSDTSKTFQENIAVIKALVAKYPEYREAFAGVVARGVDPSGRDYGSLLAMKEVK
jgi:hypothetical protein